VEDTWESLWWDVDEIREVTDAAIALGRIRGRGRDSGVAIDTAAGWMAHFRDGLIVRFRTYADRGAALEAAGLGE
jgi:ketosteroid isomerase-like protein